MDTSIVTALTNFGALGVVLILIMIGWLVPKPFFDRLEDENKHLKEALRIERQRGTDAENAGRVTTQLITALQDVVTEKHRERRREPPDERGLHWEDQR